MKHNTPKLKKIIAVALVLTLLCSVIAINASASSVSDMKDVDTNKWYYNAVSYCLSNNYMNGDSNTTFNPSGSVTRAQVVQVLYNMSGRPDVSNAPNPFKDVPNNKWFTSAIKWAKQNSVVSGNSATAFNPNGKVTREQVCVMFCNYWKLTTGNTLDTNELELVEYETDFTDWPLVSRWALDSTHWAVKTGFMSGSSKTNLNPGGTCIRAELAQFIKNFHNLKPIENSSEDPDNGEDNNNEDDPGTNPGGNTGTDWLNAPEIAGRTPLVLPNAINHAVPVGGYEKNGKIYNKYDIDVTDVNGVPNEFEQAVIHYINIERERIGLNDLVPHVGVQMVAETRAKEMLPVYTMMADGTWPKWADKGGEGSEWVHSRPLPIDVRTLHSLNEYRDWQYEHFGESEMFDTCYNDWNAYTSDCYRGAGRENGGGGYGTPKSVVVGWMNSPGHKDALLDPNIRYVGVSFTTNSITTSAAFNAQ